MDCCQQDTINSMENPDVVSMGFPKWHDAKMEAFNALLAAFLPLGQWQQMMFHLDDVRGETKSILETPSQTNNKSVQKLKKHLEVSLNQGFFFWRLRWFERFLLRCDMLCTCSATNIAVEVVEAGILILEKNDQQFEMNMMETPKKQQPSLSFPAVFF